LLSEPEETNSVVRLGLAARSATEFVSSGKRLKFLDLCAGSGAIGCAALARLPDAQVYFGEIDSAHEKTILKNIRENNLDELRAHVCIGDLFEPFGNTKFDIIAANPPYIPSGRELPPSVADYEPSQALYSGEDGLDIIRRIATELPKHLNSDGEAWIECDSPTAETARELFVAQGFSAKIRNDQYGAPRVIVVSFR
jgi:HemK-like putative methylase